MDGLTISVRVQPKAKRNAVEATGESSYKVWVTAAPESGKANDAVVALLSEALGVPRSGIELVRGGRSRDKVFRVHAARGR